MENLIKIKKMALSVGFFLLLPTASQAVTHTIQFGGSLGMVYSPSTFTAKVGDTVKWTGSFTLHPLSSTTVPTGASSWHNAAGTTFEYVIKVAGQYNYQCDTHVSLGMVGSFSATAGTEIIAPINKLDAFSIAMIKNKGKSAIQLNLPHSGSVDLHMVNLSGKEISLPAVMHFKQGLSQLVLPSLPKGLYMIRAVFDEKEFSKPYMVLR